jgi:nucleotide-binding universal stress UspA family protein
MSTNRILFPTDFSERSLAALETAVSLARDRNATLVVAHCQETPLAYGGDELAYGVPAPDDAELKSMLDHVVERVQDVPCEKRLLRGVPWRSIVGLAEKEDVKFIVMATHGRLGLLRLLMGSVAEAVVRHAHCPVLTIRQPAKVAAEVG